MRKIFFKEFITTFIQISSFLICFIIGIGGGVFLQKTYKKYN